MQPVLFADDKQFWYQTQRVLGHAAYGGADTGEVLSTAQRIVSGDYDSWHDEWLATAERIAREAEGAIKAGHRISGRDGLLRASNYYRCAEFFLHGQPDDPRIDYSYEQSVACFGRAAALFSAPVEPIEIPFDPVALHGYFYRGAGHGPLPTIVMHNGFDGPVEEMHFFGAAAAAERGYNVVSFDGPGQPAARHRDGLPFRPDWENVVTPVVDWAAIHPGVDPFRIALLGVSMGGYLAARAAAFEHRLAACIAVDGIYDLSAETPRAFLASNLDYTLGGGVAEKISCPTLICEAEEDIFFKGQPEQVYDHLTCAKTLMRFSSAEGAGAHCHSGAQRLAFGRIFDWLADTLEV
jgi:dipeptidyl aminopeptidase/acylaminoacyl peptidase